MKTHHPSTFTAESQPHPRTSDLPASGSPSPVSTRGVTLPLVRAKLLRALKACGGYWLDEDTLYIQLNLAHPGVSRDQLLDVLHAWKEKNYIDFRVDELTGLTEWQLTTSGKKLGQRVP